MTMLDTDQPRHTYRSPMRMGAVVGVLVAVLVLTGCGDDDAGQADPDPAAVIAAYAAAFNAHDLDAVVAVFAADAVIIGHPRRANDVEGTDTIRTIHEELLDLAAADNAYEFVDVEVNGNMVTFDSTFTNNAGRCFPSPGHNVEVIDGKIVHWEFGSTNQPCT